MIKEFNGFDPTPRMGQSLRTLPTGGYVAEILEVENANGFLFLKLDIVEGEYEGYFTEAYAVSYVDIHGQKKWKGRFGFRVPVEGSEHFERDVIHFNECLWAILDSNRDFEWDWDEQKLVGLQVGINIRAVQYDIHNYQGEGREIGRLETVNDVHAGRIRPMIKRTAKGNTGIPVVKKESDQGIDDLIPRKHFANYGQPSEE